MVEVVAGEELVTGRQVPLHEQPVEVRPPHHRRIRGSGIRARDWLVEVDDGAVQISEPERPPSPGWVMGGLTTGTRERSRSYQPSTSSTSNLRMVLPAPASVIAPGAVGPMPLTAQKDRVAPATAGTSGVIRQAPVSCGRMTAR
jgi:hypothetical protein